MDNLEKLRKEIDDIDKELMELFEQRMERVIKIGEYKKEKDYPVLDKLREEEVLAKNLSYLKNKNLLKGAEEFSQVLIKISKKIQEEIISSSTDEQGKSYLTVDKAEGRKMVVGFQGVPGSFSEQALREYFKEDVETFSVDEFEDIFKNLEMGEIDYGILPIENSSTGGIAEVYDHLCKYGFYIVGEKCVKVDHNLLAVEGATLEDITEVYSHPQAFQQCSEFLKKYRWNLIPYRNTAVSAKLVSEDKSKAKAAIASKRAAELYNLNILEPGISNNDFNYTRFIIIGRNLEIKDSSNKISIMVSTQHKPGALHSILGHFAKNNLNMLKIESRPMKNKSWEYLFYIDFEGNLKEKSLQDAIQAIRKESVHFQLLGNYKADESF